MQIYIIGASFAGVSCALTAQHLYPESTIHLIEAQSFLGFIPSGLNLKLNEEIMGLSEAKFIDEKEIRSKGIKLYLNTRITKIDAKNQILHWQSDDQTGTFTYEVLVLALGSKQVPFEMVKGNHSRILSTKNFTCAETALNLMDEVQEVLIVGGGQIGLEATEALVNANKQVTLVEAGNHLGWRYFDEDFIQDIQTAIERVGVQVCCHEEVLNIETDHGLRVTTQNTTYYPDAVLFGMNVIPASAQLKDVVELNQDGTVKVDCYLRTDVANILAVGDMVRVPTLLSESEYDYIALVNNAVRSGQVAAFNLKDNQVPQSESLRVIGSRLFSQYIVSLGLTQAEAERKHLTVSAVYHTSVYTTTEPSPVILKLIVEQENGRILGAQIKSESNILHLADVLAMALTNGLTDKDLAFQDRLYYPNQTAIYPVIYQAALNSVIQRLKSHS